jgi:hypothetical protein
MSRNKYGKALSGRGPTVLLEGLLLILCSWGPTGRWARDTAFLSIAVRKGVYLPGIYAHVGTGSIYSLHAWYCELC